MAEPPPATMTVTIAVPILANIFSSTHDLQMEVHNLRTEIRDLRTDFTTRIEALEAQLARQPTTRPPPDVITDRLQDLVEDATLAHEDRVHQEGDRIDEQNLHVQMDDRLDRNDLPQQDDIIQEDEDTVTREDAITSTQEENIIHDHEKSVTHTYGESVTQQDDVTHEEGKAVNSLSPSVDEGITGVAEPVIPPPPAAAAAGGKKRKRTIHDAPAYIDGSGFMIRSSDAQLAEKRNGEAKRPSRSESPFDHNDDRDESSDGVEELPPKRPPAHNHRYRQNKEFVHADQELRRLDLISSLLRRQKTSQSAGMEESETRPNDSLALLPLQISKKLSESRDRGDENNMEA